MSFVKEAITFNTKQMLHFIEISFLYNMVITLKKEVFKKLLSLPIYRIEQDKVNKFLNHEIDTK